MYIINLIFLVQMARGLNIHEYTSPIVTVKEGLAWMLNGHFNLVHVVDLQRYDKMIDEIRDELNMRSGDSRQGVIQFHLTQAERSIRELKGKQQKRSIDWLGSAWKWLAGSPDAADWNEVLRSENNIIRNNNQQYKINRKLFNVTEQVISRYNKLMDTFRNNISDRATDRIMDHLLDKTLILKEELHELIRACQMARSGIVNTNLLDDQEIEILLTEEVSLPYQKEIEAMEHATPSIYANRTILLYVISLPKVREEAFNHVLVLPTIEGNRQVDLQFADILMNQQYIFGIKGKCTSIRNSTVCDRAALLELDEKNCLVKLLRGGEARCTLRTNSQEIISIVNEDTIFLTNFMGSVTWGNETKWLNGTFIVKIYNESVTIKGVTYVSRTTTRLQLLPSVLAKITGNETKLDVEYLNHLNMENTLELKELQHKSYWSLATDLATILLIICLALIIWKHLMRSLKLPSMGSLTSEVTSKQSGPTKPPRLPIVDLRDAGI